ncbi:MAG: AAA family ATPase [Rhodomicrobiaceae bacterium]
MLNRQTRQKPQARGEIDHFFFEPDYISYADIASFVRRYFFTILSCISAGLLSGILFVSSATPFYTARAEILIDPTTTQLLQEQRTQLVLDAASIESQIAFIMSDTIVGAVVKELNLETDAEFRGNSVSWLSRVYSSLFGSSDEQTAPQLSTQEQKQIAVEALRSSLDVRRLGLSYAIDIYVTTMAPEKSARIANAVAGAYEREQVAARTKAARQSSEWLESRLQRLRGKLDDAARALQNMKAGRDVGPATGPAPTDAPATVEALDATVQAYRTIYESYYQALTNAGEQQTYPISNARVITPAETPRGKSYPRSKLVIALGIFAGLLSGVGLAFLRLNMDSSVRTPKQVKNYIGLECLARIPKISQPMSFSPKSLFFSLRKPEVDRQALFHYVTEAPFSQFAGAVTALKTSIVKAGRQDGIRSIGITSALPEEGKSTLAVNLATAFALSSYKTLIIDADIHNPVISQNLASGATEGLFEVLKGEAEPKDCIIASKGAMPDILPMVGDKRISGAYSWLSSESMLLLLKYLKEKYHFVVVDLPPLAPVPEGLTISSLLDSVLLAVEWGKTPRDVLADVTYGLNLADANILGIVLTKVDESAVQLRLKKAWKYY